jgi:hypothetical protein
VRFLGNLGGTGVFLAVDKTDRIAKSLTGYNLLISRGMSEIASFDDSYFSGYADLNLSILFPVNT